MKRNAKRCAPRIEVPANCATVHLRLQLRETARGLVGISTQSTTVTFSDGHGDSVPVIASAGLPRLQMNAELGELETVRSKGDESLECDASGGPTLASLVLGCERYRHRLSTSNHCGQENSVSSFVICVNTGGDE